MSYMTNKKGKMPAIRSMRNTNNVDMNEAEVIWRRLSSAIDKIHNKNASELSYEELYRYSYNLVLNKHGEFLYNCVKNCLEIHMAKVAATITSCPDEKLLAILSEEWSDHQVTMVMIRDILMYMDRTFVSSYNKTPVYDMGQIIFRDTILYHEKVRGRLRNILLKNVSEERAGRIIDRGLMSITLSMLVSLGINTTRVYEDEFEIPFLEEMRQFYSIESRDFINNNTCIDYIRKVETRYEEEKSRGNFYLHHITTAKMTRILDDELVSKHAKTLVEMENSGCEFMFKEEKIEDLKRMYALVSRVPSTLDVLRDKVNKYIKHSAEDLMQAQEGPGQKDPTAVIKGLLNLRRKFFRICNESFNQDQRAKKSVNDAFEEFVNVDGKTAKYLAYYADDLLKSSIKGLGEDEADHELQKVILIFRYLKDKDIFENYYKLHLSKRLLGGRSISDEFERNMIAKLKGEYGYQFTSKLEGMFTDMNMSRDMMHEFRSDGSTRLTGIELEVNILTTGFWPTHNVPACPLPESLLRCCESFERYYLVKHAGRKIAWQTHMGTADLKAKFNTGRHELIVTTYQMCLLMLFNKTDRLSLNEIKATVCIPDQELKRHLLSLCTPKHKILSKASKGKFITDDDIFTFNADFSSKLKRVRIPLLSSKEGNTEEVNDTNLVQESIEEDRKNLIDACVVRIMKARKHLDHNALVSEATRQLSSRFAPSSLLIKKRIESLIEREYIERDESDRRSYKYVA